MFQHSTTMLTLHPIANSISNTKSLFKIVLLLKLSHQKYFFLYFLK